MLVTVSIRGRVHGTLFWAKDSSVVRNAVLSFESRLWDTHIHCFLFHKFYYKAMELLWHKDSLPPPPVQYAANWLAWVQVCALLDYHTTHAYLYVTSQHTGLVLNLYDHNLPGSQDEGHNVLLPYVQFHHISSPVISKLQFPHPNTSSFPLSTLNFNLWWHRGWFIIIFNSFHIYCLIH